MALYKGQRQGVRGVVDWGQVSSYMGGTRSSKHCKMRWYDKLKFADIGLAKEGAWTEDEVISLTHATIVHVMYCLCL